MKDALEKELEALDRRIVQAPSPELFLHRGRLLWRMQRHAAAMADYERAAAGEGEAAREAAVALQLARDVMDFFNKDLYNP